MMIQETKYFSYMQIYLSFPSYANSGMSVLLLSDIQMFVILHTHRLNVSLMCLNET